MEEHPPRLEDQRSKKQHLEEPAGRGASALGHEGPHCESLRSHCSMDRLIDLKAGQETTGGGPDHRRTGVLNGVGLEAHLGITLQDLKENIHSFVEQEVTNIWNVLIAPNTERKVHVVMGVECEEEQRSNREALVNIIVSCLRTMKQEPLAERLRNRCCAGECQRQLQKILQKKVQRVFEGIPKVGNPAPLNQIYTELYITEGSTDQVNEEHEVQRIETVFRKPSRPERTIRQEDLFTSSAEGIRPRCVLTKGVAGIGKTLLTQKMTLDWAEDKAHQNFQLLFPFTFRELNLLSEKKLSLVELVHLFFPEAKVSGLSSIEGVQVLFILDGLDECRLPLDFNSRVLTAATESTSVDVLLTNLIRGNLLPSAQLWMTTRPAAANQIPPECVDMVTEVRGFTDLQKEEYFRKRFRDEEQTTIISHIRSSRSLHIMCHIPIFCWITATVLEDMLKSRESGELPKTLTEMYIHFLVVQAKVKKIKYNGRAGTDAVWDPESRKMMESLGKLAFEQLQRGNLIFYESDLTECDIDVEAASKYSGVFTQIFREERGLYQDKVYCFVHLSVQEFLAALHVHQTFSDHGVNLLGPKQTFQWLQYLGWKPPPSWFYLTAIEKALKSQNGHLDLFLRFLLGLSLQQNQTLLRGLVAERHSWSKENSAQLIKKKLNENASPERIINLFHCLNEVEDTSLVEEVQRQLRSGHLSSGQLSPAQWSALAFILLSSQDNLEVFDLNKYAASEEVLLRLLPAVKVSQKVRLRSCRLSRRSCPHLTSILSSPTSTLTMLDLSNNNLQDSGVKLLSRGLTSSHCQLKILRLRMCDLTDRSAPLVSSVLSSPSSMMEELDLSFNNLQDSGVESLSAGLKSPHCCLETLRLQGCGLSMRSCGLLSFVISSPSRLTELDLSENDLEDCGVSFLGVGLKSPHCHLDTLRLSGCLISADGCPPLAKALRANPSHLRHLDLSYNDPGGPGLKALQAGLKREDWRLETLRLDHRGQDLASSVPSTCPYL